MWKEPGVSQRLIWAGNRSNLLLNPELSPVDLASPDIVASMFFDDKHKLHMAGCDISQYYNLLAAPKEVVTLLGMPRISGDALGLSEFVGNVIAWLTFIPMGATF